MKMMLNVGENIPVKMSRPLIVITLICLVVATISAAGDEDGFCPVASGPEGPEETCQTSMTKYLLYTVNYGEGFNLRRDVYIRFANLVHKLNSESSKERWVLVLPPWYRLYHWFNSRHTHPVPWAQFFDLASMKRYVPVIELDQYIKDVGRSMSRMYILQHYAEGWGSDWEEKYHERPCIDKHEFRQVGSGWEGTVSGRLLFMERLSCLSVQGTTATIVPLIRGVEGDSLVLSRGETLLHQHFAGPQFWEARRSMRFAGPLVALASSFRAAVLNSTDEGDGVLVPGNWREQKGPPSSPPRGGAYLSVHLRRRDFVQAKPKEVPQLRHAAQQVQQLLKKLQLQHVYLASDAPEEEVSEFVVLLRPYSVVRYSSSGAAAAAGSAEPTDAAAAGSAELTDGELAIVDQIIAAHARHFIGSHESTFSFRIQEEREILGFPPSSTFNRLCGDRASTCEQPAKWTIVYE